MKKLKSCLAIILVLVMVICALPVYSSAVTQNTSLNLRISENCIAQWDKVDNAAKYKIHATKYSDGNVREMNDNYTTETHFNIQQEFDNYDKETGHYMIWVAAYDSNGSYICHEQSSVYYNSPLDKAPEPQNLRWVNDTTLSWDEVLFDGVALPDTEYRVALKSPDGSSISSRITSNTTCGFSDYSYKIKDGCYITVVTLNPLYRESTAAESPRNVDNYGYTSWEYTVNTTYTRDDLHIEIDENGVMSWDNVPNAVRYDVELSLFPSGGGVEGGQTVFNSSFDFKGYCEQYKKEPRVYYVAIKAYNSSNTRIATEVVAIRYSSDLPKISAPSNLRWSSDKKTAHWDAPLINGSNIPGITYNVALKSKSGNRVILKTTFDYMDFTGYITDGESYYFTVEASLDGYRNSNIAESQYNNNYVKYPIYIGGTQITEGNRKNLDQNKFAFYQKGETFSGQVLSRDTLIFKDLYIDGKYYTCYASDNDGTQATVYINTDKDLDILLIGFNDIRGCDKGPAIYFENYANLYFKGDGTLTVDAGNKYSAYKGTQDYMFFNDNVDVTFKGKRAIDSMQGDGSISLFDNSSVYCYSYISDAETGLCEPAINNPYIAVLNGAKLVAECEGRSQAISTWASDDLTVAKYNIRILKTNEFGTPYTPPVGLDKSGGVSQMDCRYVEISVKYNMGDIDLNGVINSSDYAMLYSNVSCQISLTNAQKAIADLNHDGAIDAFDVIQLDLYLNGVCDIEGNYI